MGNGEQGVQGVSGIDRLQKAGVLLDETHKGFADHMRKDPRPCGRLYEYLEPVGQQIRVAVGPAIDGIVMYGMIVAGGRLESSEKGMSDGP